MTPADKQSDSGTPTVEVIQSWLIQQIAQLIGMDPDEIDPRDPFARYGLDSVQAVTLSGDLEDWLQRQLPATLTWDYPTIEALSRHLAANEQ